MDEPTTGDETQPTDATAGGEVGGDRPVAADGPGADAPVDTRVPDAAGTCGVNGDCTDPTKAFCVASVCIGCQSAGVSACVAPTPACDLTSGKCVGCTADSQCTTDPSKGFCVAGSCTGCDAAGATGCSARTDGKTTCASTGTATGQCVACVADAQCTTDPTKGFCVANTCTGCNTTGATGCSTRTDGKIVCATTGTTAGQCVVCVTDAQCTTDPTKGFCVANACTGCNAAGATGCAARTDGKTTCAATGTAAGQCVECTTDSQCTANPSKGFCVANACTGCNTTGATGCTARTDGKNVCAVTGTVAGQCVVCVASSDCKVATTPICNATNVCAACTLDSQCSAKLGATGNPGVCMNNVDGHCATDAETVYVQNVAGICTDSGTGAGAAATPFCTARTGVNVAGSTSTKTLVVLTGTLADFGIAVPSKVLTVVGKSAVITPAAATDGIDITSGTVYLRSLTIKGTASPATGIGINAGTGGGAAVTLHMDTCAVINNPGGGILLNGAAFDIKDATVTGNGPGTAPAGATYGGIRVEALPASGTTSLSLVTIQNNNGGGLSCAGTVQGTGILSTGNINTPTQIGSTCGITTCSTSDASASCGAQTTP